MLENPAVLHLHLFPNHGRLELLATAFATREIEIQDTGGEVMMFCPRFVLMYLLVVCLCGCCPDSPVSSNASNGDGAKPSNAEAGDSTTSIADGQRDPAEPTASDDQVADDGSDDQGVGGTADAGPAQPSESRERFLLLISGGPLIVDLILSVEGESHGIALQRFVDEELAASDINRDGQTTWKEIANSTRYQYGQFRYNPVPEMRRYDGNGDGLVHPGELLQFLTRGVGPTRSFVLRSSNRYRFDSQSTVLQVLDDDQNGAIAQEEMEQVTARLASFDVDDDETLTVSDFKGDYVRPSLMMSTRRPDQADMAVRISERTDWGYTRYSLAELYGDGSQLTTEDFSLSPDAFAALDEDQDGKISTEEIKGIQEMPPHLVLKASFGEVRRSGGTPRTQLQLESLSECLQSSDAMVVEHARRMSLALPGAQVQFLVNEDPMLYNTTIAKVDVDDDGKITEYEIGSFLDRQRPVVRGLVRTWVSGHEDSLFAALDVDADGVLGARELHESPERLKSLDQDGDGQLQSHEIPDSMVVAFLRGHPLQDDQMFVHAPSDSSAPRSNPPWFAAMDTNQDGEISLREFLGTPDQFQRLDRDTDGFIAPTEAKDIRDA